MPADSLARTVADVERMAPVPGYYRVRGPSSKTDGVLWYRQVNVSRVGETARGWVVSICPPCIEDDHIAVGLEISGPVPVLDEEQEDDDAD